jgi:ribosomal protein L22
MSVRLPIRQLGQPCLAAFRPRATYWVASNRAFTNSSARSAKQNESNDVDLSNPLLDEYLAKRDPNEKPERPVPQTGGLSKTGLFQKQYEIPGYRMGMTPEELAHLEKENKIRAEEIETQNDKELHALRLDPLPSARRSYERQLIIKSLRKRREGKTLRLKRTEREMVYKSQDLPTTMKKMTRLMHQLAGKTVEEALIQLRFSKKRVARDILKGLQLARDEAIAARGMGLGAAVDPETLVKESALIKAGKMKRTERSEAYLADGTRRRESKEKGAVIELKDGSKKNVTDPTEMYIDQAWASKGPETKSPEFRARGRINMLHHRSASKSFHLRLMATAVLITSQNSTSCSRKRRRACVSQTRSKRSARTSRYGYPFPTDLSLRSDSTVCGNSRILVTYVYQGMCDRLAFASNWHVPYTIQAYTSSHTVHPIIQSNMHASSGYPSNFSRNIHYKNSTPSLCNSKTCFIRSLSFLILDRFKVLRPGGRSQHVKHALDAPSCLTRLDKVFHFLVQLVEERVDFFAATELVGV